MSSVGVTAVALLGAAGVVAPGATGPERAGLDARPEAGAAHAGMRLSGSSQRSLPGPDPTAVGATGAVASSRGETVSSAAGPAERGSPESGALPSRTGTGKRVVFDMSAQRVWLVGRRDRVRRSYLVSGSVTDNLSPGRYEVYSTSRHAVGIDDSGTMEYMVRFAHGSRAAIGFHDIPVDDGEPVQTRAELGTPRSHGCIRQWRPDARALWQFAPVGTRVVVTA